MSETTETETAETAVTEQPATETEPDYKAEAEKWKALSRKNEVTAKENAAKAKRLDEIEEANKSELEKATEKVRLAEERATKAELDRVRSDVARDKGVPIELLTANSEEAMVAQADAALAFKGTPASTPSSEGQGKQGEPVGQTKQITSRDELKSMSREEKLAAYRDGRLKSLTG